MELKEIKDLLKWLDDSKVNEFIYKNGEEELILRKLTPAAPSTTSVVMTAPSAPVAIAPAPASAPVAAPAPVSAAPAARHDLFEQKSPMVGTVYTAANPESPTYVKVGDRVRKGQVVCIIEAMKLMNEIEAEADGVVEEVCVGNESPVEFGTILFRIKI